PAADAKFGPTSAARTWFSAEFGHCAAVSSIGRILLICCLMIGAVGPVSAADASAPHYSKPDVRKELVAVVEGQLAAFRANHFAQAYALAARALREQFTLQQFSTMIVRGYPLIAQSKRSECGLPMDD